MIANARTGGGGAAGRDPALRVLSIVRMHALLFEDPDGYEALLDFPADPRKGKIDRVVSILRAQESLLSDDAYMLSDEDAAREIPGLVKYMESLITDERIAIRKSTIIPRNLGSTFITKGFGVPLFGDYRPATVPGKGGILLCYRSPDSDGTARIEATRLCDGIRIGYRGAGVELSGLAPWIAATIAPAAEAGWEADMSLAVPGPESGEELPESFVYFRYVVSLDRASRKRSLKRRFLDPFAFEYAYFFSMGPRLASNLRRFVADLLSGVFGIPLRDAEKIAETFTGRLP